MEIVYLPFHYNKSEDEIIPVVSSRTEILESEILLKRVFIFNDHIRVAKIEFPHHVAKIKSDHIQTIAFLLDCKYDEAYERFVPIRGQRFSIANDSNFTIYECLLVEEEGIVAVPFRQRDNIQFISFRGIKSNSFVKIPEHVFDWRI